jgi:hypothetical protein
MDLPLQTGSRLHHAEAFDCLWLLALMSGKRSEEWFLAHTRLGTYGLHALLMDVADSVPELPSKA